MKFLTLPFVLAIFCSFGVPVAWPAVTGQWDFNSGTLTATIGAPLQFRGDSGAHVQFGSTATLGIQGINAQVAQVIRIPAFTPTQGLVMNHGGQPNGGGAKVNRYTLILDLYYPTASGGWRSLWQTEPANPPETDGDLFVNPSNGVGISGQYQGHLPPNTWCRVAFTVDCTRRELGKYLNGTNVVFGPLGETPLGTEPLQYLSATEGNADQRWALDSIALLFADEDAETQVVYVNSVQFHDRVLTPTQIAALGGPSAAGIPTVIPATIAQWDFNGTLASTSGGSNLISGAALPASAAGVTHTSVLIGGEPAQVAAFTRGTYFRVSHGFAPNGGGSLSSSYSLLIDVMFPSRPTGWAALWQTSSANNNDGDWFVNPADGLGTAGSYFGSVTDGNWHRLGLVIDANADTLTSFVNGQKVQQLGGIGTDGRWMLGPAALLFADENQENAAGFINSLQLRNRALSDFEIGELGGPSAAGIPVPIQPILALRSPNGQEYIQAGSTQQVLWAALNPSGGVQIDLYRGGQLYRVLGQVPMRASNFTWLVNSRLGDTNNYRIRVGSLSFTNVFDVSDLAFTVFGSVGAPSAAFGQALQSNGGFEQQLADWQTLEGRPTTLIGNAGKGVPHGGSRFFHGGLNPGGNTLVRQEIDLLDAGFSRFDIDSGAALEAEAWLRNQFGANTFDDQVFSRVAYLDESGRELSSIRCLVAGNNVWLRRILTGLVPPGTRTLRLEVVGRHRRDLDNDSMADDLIVRLQESVPATPRITKLPLLQDVRTNAMTLLWETDGNLASHSVEWGRSNVAERTLSVIETLQIDSSHFVHRATLTGLETETEYVYRVRSGSGVTPSFRFRTAPHRETPFAVAWWGDSHAGTGTLRTHVSNMLAHAPDLVCVAGDMVNSGDALDEWHNYWFKPLEHLSLGQTRPVMYARGNHDGEHALAYAYSALPGNEAWFAFDYGNTRFIFLDSEVSTAGSPEQRAWLNAELSRPETQRAAFRIVCFHRPPYVNLWNGGGHTGESWVRTDWVPLFEQKNVDIVISGHAHNYNRGAQNGVTYIVSGGGGGVIDVERVANWPLYTVEYSRYHFDLMEVIGETLHWRVFDERNQLIDEVTLRSRTATLSWLDSPGSNGTSLLLLAGKPGTAYVTESSPNLQTWAPLRTNALPATGTGLATNAIQTSGTRFFRARATP